MRYLLLLALLAGCYTAPVTVAPDRGPMPVAASKGRTWDAVIDVFADRNIPIRTIDRSSGFIATEALAVTGVDSLAWADCGDNGNGSIRPNFATYNVLVRGDSSSSTVRITVRWVATAAEANCVTTGVWETEAEKDIKTRSEKKGP